MFQYLFELVKIYEGFFCHVIQVSTIKLNHTCIWMKKLKWKLTFISAPLKTLKKWYLLITFVLEQELDQWW